MMLLQRLRLKMGLMGKFYIKFKDNLLERMITMKKFYKTFTFYFAVIGIIIIVLNISGKDDINLFLIGLNPILNLLDNSKVVCDFMNSNDYFWHIASFITNLLYGLIFDFIRIKMKKERG